MTGMNESSFRERRLARALRGLREEVRMSQHEAATVLEFNNRKLSRIELGQVPGYHEFRAMLDVYGVPVSDWEPYLDLYRRAKEKGWWHAYGIEDAGYVSLEDEASEVNEFQLGFVPGLVQTEEYIRASFAASRVPHSRRWVDNQVAVRLRRQLRLTDDENPLRYHAILDEASLTDVLADPEVMPGQVRRIAEVAALPNVTIQVLPRAMGLHDGRNSSFVLLGFPDAEDPDVLYLGHLAGAVHIDKPEKVRGGKVVFGHLRGLALGREESVAWLDRLATEL